MKESGMLYHGGEQRVLRELEGKVRTELERVGILVRLFARVKSEESVQRKIELKQYGTGEGKLRDLFGIRVAVYFGDDVDVVAEAIERLFSRVESTIDAPGTQFFGPRRHNIVVKLPEWAKKECLIDWAEGFIDDTLEIQVRTVLSEGWHEVEHDLRYKESGEWIEHADLSRALNGILATIETCDWGVLQLLDELTVRHYNSKRWNAMLRSKLRVRLVQTSLSSEVFAIVSRDSQIQQELFRFPRVELLRSILRTGAEFPLTADNLFFIINRLFLKYETVRELEPASFSALMLRAEFEDVPQ